jgi:hypothetical protein
MAPYPPYSSDLAPSDFFLFAHVKHALEGAEFPSEEGLLAAIHSVLSNLTGETLRGVFAKWVERLNWVALNDSPEISDCSRFNFSGKLPVRSLSRPLKLRQCRLDFGGHARKVSLHARELRWELRKLR